MSCHPRFRQRLFKFVMLSSALLIFTITSILPGAIQADLVYNNQLPVGQYQNISRNGPGFSTFGDDVNFSTPQSVIIDVTFQLTATQPAGNPVGSLVMYVYDDINGATGDLLGFGFLPDFAFSGNGDQAATFSGLAIDVGASAFIGLAIPNQDLGRPAPSEIGIGFGGIPDVGSSESSSWIVVNGAGFQPGTTANSASPVPGIPSNFLIQVEGFAVPEPGLVPAILLAGIAIVFPLRRKRTGCFA